MVEYSVILKRFPGSSKPDLCIFQDEDREKAIQAMKKYVDNEGFTAYDPDGRFTIQGVHLIEKEPIVGKPVISDLAYHEIFDTVTGKRR